MKKVDLDDSVKDALIWKVQQEAVDLFVKRWKFRLGLAAAVALAALALIGFNLRPWMDGVAKEAMKSKIAEISEGETSAIQRIKLEQAIALQGLVVAIEEARTEATEALGQVKDLTPQVQVEVDRLEQTRLSLNEILGSLNYLKENADELPVLERSLRAMSGRSLDYETRLQKLEDATFAGFSQFNLSAKVEFNNDGKTRTNRDPKSGFKKADLCTLATVASYGGASKTCHLDQTEEGWALTASGRKATSNCIAVCFTL